MSDNASDNSLLSVSIQEVRDQISVHKTDTVVVEEPLEIWVKYIGSKQTNTNNKAVPISTTMRTPGDDINLVKGWLYTIGNVTMDELLDIKHTGTQVLKTGQSNRVVVSLPEASKTKMDKLERSEVVNSSCGVCGFKKIDDLLSVSTGNLDKQKFTLDYQKIMSLVQELGSHQPQFSTTGGTHGVGLFNVNGRLLDVREDVGRHNAMDKLVGANLHQLDAPLGAILSGRVSFEMVLKALKAQLSMIIAVGAPSSLAIALAQEADISLYGFVSGEKINCYTPVG